METTSRVADPYLLGAEPQTSAGQRHRMICEAAYFLAQARGFAPGYELDDWLLAERQVDAASAARHA